MKTSLALAATLVAAALAGCGDGAGPSLAHTAATPGLYWIQPLGNASTCLSDAYTMTRDHRTSPPTITYQHAVGKMPCQGANANAIIRVPGGALYTGGTSNVQIQLFGVCLSNPNAYDPRAFDSGRLTLEPCVDIARDHSERALRQTFVITTGPGAAVELRSNLAFALGRPSPAPECIEGVTPTTVRRQACSGLRNWQLKSF